MGITSQLSGSPDSKDSHLVYHLSWPLVPGLGTGEVKDYDNGGLVTG